MAEPCVFCEIVAGREPADIRQDFAAALVITPLSPVTPGHELVIPKRHVADALIDPGVTGLVMEIASQWAQGSCNLITSVGASATQTVRHLHVHIVPRRPGDGLLLPWSLPTEGDDDAG